MINWFCPQLASFYVIIVIAFSYVSVYTYLSLQAFNVVFHKAVQNADASSDVKARVNTLIDCITFSTFNYINRGLFERDKLTFAAQLTFQVNRLHMKSYCYYTRQLSILCWMCVYFIFVTACVYISCC